MIIRKLVLGCTIAGVVALAMPHEAQAQKRKVGNAAMGAAAGLVVGGPVGLVAGGIIGYGAGEDIARGMGIKRHRHHHHGRYHRHD